MAFCTACGTPLQDGAVFCTNCGTRVFGFPAPDNIQSSHDPQHTAEEKIPAYSFSGGDAGSSLRDTVNQPPSGEQAQVFGAAPSGNLGYLPLGTSPDKAKSKDNSKVAIIVIASVTVLVLILAALLFWGVSAARRANSSQPSSPSSETPVATPAQNPNSVSGSGTVGNGDFSISVIGAEHTSDVDGKSTIRIYFEFGNNYDYAISAYSAVICEAQQDGNALTEAYLWVTDDEYDPYYNSSLLVRPGAALLCSWEMNYNPNGGPVDVVFYDAYEGADSGTVRATYDPGSLPGRPSYTGKTFDSPQWTINVPEAGILDEIYDVKVTTAELLSDYEGRPAIRVYYEFTNNSTEATSLYYALYCLAYQDGVQLASSEVKSPTSTDEAYFAELQPGQSISASCVFVLRNETSPVEAEIEASYSYDSVGQTYEIK